MMANKLGLNLARRSYLNRRAFVISYWVLLVLLTLVLAWQIWQIFSLQQINSDLSLQLNRLDQELIQVGGKPQKEVSAEQMSQQKEMIQVANDILQRESFRWTNQLDRLERLMVDGVTIRALQPNYKEGTLRLLATAESLVEMRAFIDSLNHSGEFSDVFLLDQSRAKYTDSREQFHDVINFNLILKGAF